MKKEEEEYLERHIEFEKEVEKETHKIRNSILATLLLISEVINSNKSQKFIIMYTRKKILDMYLKDLDRYVKEYTKKTIKESIKWELKAGNFSKKIYLKDVFSEIFNNKLITKNTFKEWLLKAVHKDTANIIKIIKNIKIDRISPKKINKILENYYKSPLNVVSKLIDAIAFSSLSITRKFIFEKNEVKYVEWISTLDSKTTQGCIIRDGLIYNYIKKLPYKHNIKWEEPGIYHWGCRSFVIPYSL